MALDYFLKAMGAEAQTPKSEAKSLTVSFKVDDVPLILVKPQTFMNISGEAVQELMSYYKIPSENLIVVHDDLDHAFGVLKIKTQSGDAGHNGIKSIIEKLGHNDFARVKIGIGRPAQAEMDVARYVLQNFSKVEQEGLPEILNRAVDAIESIIFEGLTKSMNTFNAVKSVESKGP